MEPTRQEMCEVIAKAVKTATGTASEPKAYCMYCMSSELRCCTQCGKTYLEPDYFTNPAACFDAAHQLGGRLGLQPVDDGYDAYFERDTQEWNKLYFGKDPAEALATAIYKAIGGDDAK